MKKSICKWCDTNLADNYPLRMLDVDGVLSSVSGNKGYPCHSIDDSHWLCGHAVYAVKVAYNKQYRRPIATPKPMRKGPGYQAIFSAWCKRNRDMFNHMDFTPWEAACYGFEVGFKKARAYFQRRAA